MNCQSLFSRENKKTVLSLSSAELAQRLVNVKSVPKVFYSGYNSYLVCSTFKA